jgi:hypothetical protein
MSGGVIALPPPVLTGDPTAEKKFEKLLKRG